MMAEYSSPTYPMISALPSLRSGDIWKLCWTARYRVFAFYGKFIVHISGGILFGRFCNFTERNVDHFRKEDQYDNNTVTTLDVVQSQLGALSTYLSATIWIINPSGRMILDSSQNQISPDRSEGRAEIMGYVGDEFFLIILKARHFACHIRKRGGQIAHLISGSYAGRHDTA